MTEPAGELPAVGFPEDDNRPGPEHPGDGAARDLIPEPDDDLAGERA